MSVFNILSFIGGLAMFLYGMQVMGSSLEKTAGSKLKSILAKLTATPIKGLLFGAAVTAVIQSSSATTVMVVGFVNSGVMQLGQAIGIIMGANIGTTITSWILSLAGIEGTSILVQLFKPSSFAPVLAAVGVCLILFGKRDKQHNIGSSLMGFALLMFGMEMMSTAVKPLADVPAFTNILTMFSNPILGVLVGIFVTAVVQSSSASIGILQALSATGQLSIASALPIILGQNIGTCVTALISSVGTNRSAKRAAIVHLYFNLIGTVLAMLLFYGLDAVIGFGFLDMRANYLSIAIIHTAFNVFCTVVLFPFTKQLERLAMLTIPGENKSSISSMLDNRLLATPTLAVEQGRKVTVQMAELSRDAISRATALFGKYSEAGFNEVLEMEDETDRFEDTLGSYLIKASACELSADDSREVFCLLHLVTDLERLGDHARNIAESAKELYDKGLSFSNEAKHEFSVLISAVNAICELSIRAFSERSCGRAEEVEPLEEIIDSLVLQIKTSHTRRLTKGACGTVQGFIANDILTDLERISDHCSNIAISVIERIEGNYDPHENKERLKRKDENAYNEMFAYYREKYSLQQAQ